MAKKDLSTDASAASSLTSAHFQGSLDSSPSHTYYATGKGMPSPLQTSEILARYVSCRESMERRDIITRGVEVEVGAPIPVGRGVVLTGLCGPHLGP